MRTVCTDRSVPKTIAARALGAVWKGAYLSRLNPARFVELPDPPLPDARCVRVQNRLSLICGSDLHLLFLEADPAIALAALPSTRRVYLGHEVCGEVVEAGAQVTSVAAGDRVALRYPIPFCATQSIEPLCPRCREGSVLLCENQAAGRGHVPIGGGWGDRMVVHETQLYRPPLPLSDEAVALLEPASVGLHAVCRALPRLGSRVLVVGCGIVGIAVTQALRALAPEVAVIVLARHRFQADALVATCSSLRQEDVLVGADGYEVTGRATGAAFYQAGFGSKMLLGGFDSVFDCVGTSRTLTDSLRWVRAGGTVVAVGIQYKMYKVDLSPLYYQEINLLGSWGYGQEEWGGLRLETFELAARLVERGDLVLDGLVTHRFPLGNWREAVAVFAEKKDSHAVKVALVA
jgi:threonine dehydrogenase-like Zn-dependent dehydrogenase